MIEIILGNQGSGKTLFMVERAYHYYKMGKTIYSNVKLKFPFKPLNYNDIINCKLHNGVVVLDEGHLLLSNRRSMSHHSIKITDSFLGQCRKQNLILLISTQRIRKLDVKIREECDVIYECEKYAFEDDKFVLIEHNQNLDKKIPVVIKVNITKTFNGERGVYHFLGNKFFDMYDTFEIIKIEGLE